MVKEWFVVVCSTSENYWRKGNECLSARKHVRGKVLHFPVRMMTCDTSLSIVKQDSLSILASVVSLLLRTQEPLIKSSLDLSLKPHSLLHCHTLVRNFYPKSVPAQKHSPVSNTPIMYMLRQGKPEPKTNILQLTVIFQGFVSTPFHTN